MKAHCLFLILAGCLLAGCAQAAPHSRPAALDSLAAQFKAAAGTNRLAVARKIARLMPACRVVYANGWFWHLFSFDGDEDFNWSHPSYRLSKDDAIAALGTPDHIRTINISDRWDFLSWRVGRDRRQDECGLYIHCFNGLVVSGGVLKTNTVQSIVIHTTLTNSVNVLFLWIQLSDQKRLRAKSFCSFGQGCFRIVKNANQFAPFDKDKLAKMGFGPVRLVFGEKLQFLFKCHIHPYVTSYKHPVNCIVPLFLLVFF